MTTDNYNPETSLDSYYPSRTERRPARLWSREKALHDFDDLGFLDFFEGAGDNPTGLSGYSVSKLWLRTNAGVTDAVGTVRYYAGGDASLLASWPELTREGYAAHVNARPGYDLDYAWSTSTSGDPGSGKIRGNNATLGSISSIAISKTGRIGQSFGAKILLWQPSDVLRIYGIGASTSYIDVTLSGAPADQSTYYTIACTVTSSSALINGQIIGVNQTPVGLAAVASELVRGTRSTIKALDTNAVFSAYCTEAGREGFFLWRAGDYSAQITADTAEGLYLKADAIAATSGAWVRAYDGPVMVSWFGPAADGATNDSAVLQLALTNAGAGATVMLDHGKTYLVHAPSTMLDDQTFDMNGSTIKMCNQVSTTTTQTVTGGSTTSFTVTSSSGFAIGMSVVLAKVGVARADLVYQTSLSTTDARITNIVGNTITINSALNITGSFGSGSTLVNAFIPVMMGNRCTLKNGTIDGNRTNRAWARWEVDYLSEFPIGSAGGTIDGMTFQNSPGEGVGWFGDGHRCLNSRFLTLGGNGVHFSGATHPLVDGCWFDSGNLDISVGHADGAVSWSNDIVHATIANNFMRGFKSGCGSINTTNTDVTIIGNTMTGNKVWAIQIEGAAARVVISGNRMVDNDTDTSLVSGLGYSNTGGIFLNAVTSSDFLIADNQIDEASSSYAVYISGSGGTAERMTMTGNQIIGNVLFGGVNNSVMSNNTVNGKVAISFSTGLRFTNNTIDLEGDTTNIAIALYGAGIYRDCDVSGNVVIGGAYGLSMSTGITEITNVTMRNNSLRDQSSRGASLTNTAAACNGMMFSGNICTTGSNSATNYTGVVCSLPNITIAGNDIVDTTGVANTKIAINYSASSGAGAGGIIVNNVIRGQWASAVAMNANAGAFVVNNFVDSGTVGSATGNTISGTVTI